MRKNFEMSQEQLDAMLVLMQAEPAIMLQCGQATSVQERANNAWARLGKEMGFDPMTVRPTGRGDRFFSAEAFP